MDTPIADFVRRYADDGRARFHMPGHKGRPHLGCEGLDITEVAGADALYEADGIIAASEQNATALFGAGRTLYATEGSSQCIRAMLYLALLHWRQNMADGGPADAPQGVTPGAPPYDTARGGVTPSDVTPGGAIPYGKAPGGAPCARPLVLAARNAHKAFLYGAALLDLDVAWLWPQGGCASVCSCPVSPAALSAALAALPAPPVAVYLTSPDYLGGMADVAALAAVCHARHTLLLVDNAHGAYLHFLASPCHPLDLGADLCCDSAHKTLPVLTGGAYLHLAAWVAPSLAPHAKAALALFGSTSPSYLTLASLDLCNAALAGDLPARLQATAARLAQARAQLAADGWQTPPADPLRLVLRPAAGTDGAALAARLRRAGVECEYADCDFVVLMATPDNGPRDWARLSAALGKAPGPAAPLPDLPPARGEQVLTIRQAALAPHRLVPTQQALGAVCGAPTVACPPAVPIAVYGERIGPAALRLFAHYDIRQVEVLEDL